MSDTVSIRITADTSGVEAGIQEVRGDLGELKSTVQGAADSMTEGFAGMRGAVERSTQSMAALTASMRALKPQEIVSGLNEMASALKQNSAALQEMSTKSGEGKSGFGKLVEGIKGAAGVAGELYEAGKQAAQAIVAIGESSEKVSVLSKQLGMSTHEVQRLQAMAQATGTDFTKLSQSTATLDKNFKQSPDTFKKLGIDIKAGSDQMTILTTVADKFAKTADGPQKTAMAIKLMGQAGAETIPLLNQGGAAISALALKTDAYGAANDGAVASGTKLGESVNEAKVAWTGVTQTLTAALAPVATEIVDRFNELAKAFTQSYASGGLVKTIFDLLSGAIEGIGEIINTLGTAFADLWQISGAGGLNWSEIQHTVMNIVITAIKTVVAAIVALAISFKIEFDLIAGYALDWWGKLKEAFDFAGLGIEAIKKTFQLFGQVAYDALTLHWGSIASDWDKGLADIDATVRRRGAQIVGDAKKASEQAQGYFRAAVDLQKSAPGMLAGLQNKTPPPPSSGVTAPTPTPTPTPTPAPGRGRGNAGGGEPKDDLVQRLDAALKAKQNAWAEAQDAQGKAEAYSTQSVADYWKGILNRDNLSTKDRQQIQERYLAASQQLTEKEFGKVLDGYADRLDAAKGNAAAVLEITRQEAADIGKHYGLESDQYTAAMKKVIAARKTADDQLKALAAERDAETQRSLLAQVDDEQKTAEFRQQLGLTSEAKMLAQERAFEQERYQIRHAALEREKAEIDLNQNPLAYAKAMGAIAQLDRQHQATLTEIDRKAILARNQLQLQAIKQISSSWGSAIGKMVTLQQGFSATIKSMWQTVQQAIGDAVAKIIENWLAKEITALAVKLGLIKTQSASSIAAEAASAGAGGTASMAAAPFPMNLSAIPFGQAMSTAALSYGTMAALNVGAYDLSSDGIAMLHKGETVIPADQAGGWRNVMGLFASMPNFGVPSLGFGSAANTNAPTAANDSPSAGGGYHYHDHSARGLTESQIIANRNAFAKAMKMAHREGKLGFSLPG